MNGGLQQQARMDAHVTGQYASKLPPPLSCGRCGARFHTKKEKGQHKANCHAPIETQPQDNDDEHFYGRFAKLIPPEIKARAAAEWDAMDEEGKLPDGWEWIP